MEASQNRCHPHWIMFFPTRDLIHIFLFTIFLAIAGCNKSSKTNASEEVPAGRADTVEQDNVEVENKRSNVYSCLLHPNIVKEKPGACPICNKTLVQIND